MMDLSVKIFEGAPKIRLEELIVARNERNSNLQYGIELIEGVTSDGFFAPTKAITDGINLKPYKAVREGDFVYNPSRLNIGSLAYRESYNMCIVSHLYVVFHIREDKRDVVLPEYLLMFFRREEFKRTIDIHNFGSQRAEFNIYQLGEIEIPLPSIEVQREYVAAYKSLQQLAEQNEALIEPLQSACNAYLQEMKTKYPLVEIRELIDEFSEKNTEKAISVVKSVSVTKEFNDTNAKVNKNELGGYKIVPPGYISYVQTTKNEKCFASAINHFGYPIVVTSINRVITTKNSEVLDNDFLAMWFRTPEFSRWAIYNSWGSAREVFDFSDLKRSKIPLPPIEVQHSIVALYRCAEEARSIAKEAREQLKKLAPAMVQRAANTPVEV